MGPYGLERNMITFHKVKLPRFKSNVTSNLEYRLWNIPYYEIDK